MSNCYIISYDLKKKRDYASLYKAIKSYETWAKINESTWAIVTDQKAAEVRDFLLKNMDDDDCLFVIKSGLVAAWRNVGCKNEWLKKNL